MTTATSSTGFPVLVTGATGKLGAKTCEALLRHGFDVRATDQKMPPDFDFRTELGDLQDEYFVHRLMRDVRAVVHLGNHPNAFTGPSPQRILADNTRMNANVFQACVQHGIDRLVFASSVQAFLYTDFEQRPTRYRLPYLPLDGRAPHAPGPNTYGQSKEFAERMLQHLVAAQPQLSATALRFPMLVNEHLLGRFESLRSIAHNWFNFPECISHLTFEDAAELIALVIEQGRPGYHQYFPALAMQFKGRSTASLIAEFYPDTPLNKPAEDIAELIDISDVTRETGWKPTRRILVPIEG
jgi:nucleoside-diphosphate-sugar epimerase